MLTLICVFTASSSNLTGKQRPENWRTDVVWLLNVWWHQHLAPAWVRVSRGVGLAVTWFLFQNLSRRPPLCCHLPFGPAVKRWHAQRHIGFHYFHSYEGATLDSSQAIMANQESLPRHTHKHTHTPHQNTHLETRHCAPMKTNLFWCNLMILHHFANKMFYAVAYLPPGCLKRSGASHNAATVNQISFQFHFKGLAINN